MNTKVLVKKINKIKNELVNLIEELDSTSTPVEDKEYTEQEISTMLLNTIKIEKPENAEVLAIQRYFVDNGQQKVYVDFKSGKYTLSILDGEGVEINNTTFRLKNLIKSPAVLNYLKSKNIGDIADRDTMKPKITYLSI